LKDVAEGFIKQKKNLVLTIQRYDNILIILKNSIAVPINYQTSSMSTPSDIEWLPKNDFEHRLLLPTKHIDDWFIMNVDQFGFYRVNYDVDNWMSIIDALKKNPQVVSEKTKAQLIDDALSLASEGLVSYEIALELLMVLREETSFLPWSAAIRNLLQLNKQLSESEIHDKFQVSIACV
jgi:aminopeptidase N